MPLKFPQDRASDNDVGAKSGEVGYGVVFAEDPMLTRQARLNEPIPTKREGRALPLGEMSHAANSGGDSGRQNRYTKKQFPTENPGG